MLKLKLRFADTRSFVTRYRGTTATSNTCFTTKPKPSVSSKPSFEPHAKQDMHKFRTRIPVACSRMQPRHPTAAPHQAPRPTKRTTQPPAQTQHQHQPNKHPNHHKRQADKPIPAPNTRAPRRKPQARAERHRTRRDKPRDQARHTGQHQTIGPNPLPKGQRLQAQVPRQQAQPQATISQARSTWALGVGPPHRPKTTPRRRPQPDPAPSTSAPQPEAQTPAPPGPPAPSRSSSARSPSALSPSAPARSAPALQRPAPIPTQQSKLPSTNPALPGPSSKFRAQLHAPDRGPGPAARARVKPPDWARPAAP